MLRGGRGADSKKLELALAVDADTYNSISGMFLLLRVDKNGIAIATDRFSHMPIYANTGRGISNVLVLSSTVEWISYLLEPSSHLDRISVAELLLWDNITFPHTTRKEIAQLGPGSLHEVHTSGVAGIRLVSRTLWEPREPERWPSKRDCIDAAVAGAEQAAAEIASSATRVGVLLSGGLDSRIVAATLADKTQVETLTYADRQTENPIPPPERLQFLGLRHHLINRDPEFYAHAFIEGQRIIGFEQNSIPCHALCVAESDAIEGMDVVVGGFGCDILLKGAYVPYSMKNVLCDWYRIGTLRRSDRIGKHNYSHFAARATLVKPELVEAALDRRATYEASLRSIRPHTAEEWIGFYPISHTTSIDSMVTDRRMSHDEFYFRAGLVDASRITPWIWKKGLKIISALGRRFAPTVAHLPHPDTGLPATWTYFPSQLGSRVLNRHLLRCDKAATGPVWLSDGSFVNYAKFFEHAPAWKALRKEAFAHSEAVDFVSELMAVDTRATFASYSPAYDSLLNATIVQVIRLVDHFIDSNYRDASPIGEICDQ